MEEFFKILKDNSEDVKFLLTIYAAVVSTVVLLWRIFEFRYDRRVKIKFQLSRSKMPYSKYEEFEDGTFLGLNTTYSVVKFRIVNLGNKERFLNDINIIYRKDDTNENSSGYIDISKFIEFPKLIKPGEEIVFKVNLNHNIISTLYQPKKIISQVYDTHSRIYESNWLEIDDDYYSDYAKLKD
ncbi:MAG: hypothetical protein Q8K02_01230 [Flavobacterium sp.]|nr:hypothetical protein [Flavobacterium sp.]